MTLNDITGGDWATTRAAFETFVAARAADGSSPELSIDTGNMDQIAIESSIGKQGIRLVRDRGSVFIDVNLDGEWASTRNLLGFADGIDPRLVAASREPAPATVMARWDDMVAAAADAEAVARYNDAIGQAVIARLSPDAPVPQFKPSDVDVSQTRKRYA